MFLPKPQTKPTIFFHFFLNIQIRSISFVGRKIQLRKQMVLGPKGPIKVRVKDKA